MKLNAGIITQKIRESVEFYTRKLGFGISFQNDWYALLHTPDHSAEIAFLMPGLETQHPLFQREYTGQGLYFTIEVENVDETYNQLKNNGVNITQEIRDEAWGDRHFSITDPNGVGLDFVTYTAPAD